MNISHNGVGSKEQNHCRTFTRFHHQGQSRIDAVGSLFSLFGWCHCDDKDDRWRSVESDTDGMCDDDFSRVEKMKECVWAIQI